MIETRLHQVDPLTDARWKEFVERHPASTIFHTPEWLRALRESFGYEPVVLTSSGPGEQLGNGLPFCRVRSWLTGTRLVSLPFSDHCEPLGTGLEVCELLQALPGEVTRERVNYIEIRPILTPVPDGYGEAEVFCLHKLDLSPTSEEIFQKLHKSSVQRRIRKAERGELQYDEGTSEWHLKEFYRLFVMTRKKLRLPPQPIDWFRKLLVCLKERMKISVVLHDGNVIASLISLHYKNTTIYKYGGSNAELHSLAGVPFLFWKAILAAKQRGAQTFDFGRSDLHATGLITFKNRWGTTVTPLVYWRCGKMRQHKWEDRNKLRILQSCARILPTNLMVRIGNTLYRHIG